MNRNYYGWIRTGRAFVRRRINDSELSSLTRSYGKNSLRNPYWNLSDSLSTCWKWPHGQASSDLVTPFFIGSICSRWRDVAWTTLLLWNTILLHVSRKYHGQVQLLGDWLLNARSAPLSIELIWEDEPEYILSAFEAIMRILTTRSDYWLTFDSDPLPQCRFLKISNFQCWHQFPCNPAHSQLPILLECSLPLQNLSMSIYHAISQWCYLGSRFRAQFLTVIECLEVLRQSPNLQKCHFKHLYTVFDFIFETIMPHAQFKYLHVMWDFPAGKSTSLFDSLTLPFLSASIFIVTGSKSCFFLP